MYLYSAHFCSTYHHKITEPLQNICCCQWINNVNDHHVKFLFLRNIFHSTTNAHKLHFAAKSIVYYRPTYVPVNTSSIHSMYTYAYLCYSEHINKPEREYNFQRATTQCTVQFYYVQLDSDSLLSLITNFCSVEEIAAAKNLLFEGAKGVCSDIPQHVTRRGVNKRQTDTDDLLSLHVIIDPKKIAPKCAALKLARFPRAPSPSNVGYCWITAVNDERYRCLTTNSHPSAKCNSKWRRWWVAKLERLLG